MKRATILVVLAVFCLTNVYCELSYAAGRRGREMARGSRGGRGLKVIQPVRREVVEPLVVEPIVARPLVPGRPRRVVTQEAAPYEGPEVGLAGGLFANLPSVAGEVLFHKILGISGTGIKAGLRYAQGDDADNAFRKYALVFADGIINLNGGPGAICYLGGGLNYLAYTTGQKPGTVGGEAYLGIREGGLYGEVGYSEIRTGFSPSAKGLTLNLGFKLVY